MDRGSIIMVAQDLEYLSSLPGNIQNPKYGWIADGQRPAKTKRWTSRNCRLEAAIRDLR
jgi:hypothetical protein